VRWRFVSDTWAILPSVGTADHTSQFLVGAVPLKQLRTKGSAKLTANEMDKFLATFNSFLTIQQIDTVGFV
jgi:hypothetical protein